MSKMFNLERMPLIPIILIIVSITVVQSAAKAKPAPKPAIAPTTQPPKPKGNQGKKIRKMRSTSMAPGNVGGAAKAAAFRIDLLSIGGLIGAVLALINLIIALVNFSLLSGVYYNKVMQIHGKIKLATKEIASRDLHPKIKMSLMRKTIFMPKLFEIFNFVREPSFFDNSNDLFPNQREMRLSLGGKKEVVSNENNAESVANSAVSTNTTTTNTTSVAPSQM